MGNFLIFIGAIVLTVVIFLIYDALVQADKAQKRLPEIVEKASKEEADNRIQELIFGQFAEYISSLFRNNEKIDEDELRKALNRDFPLYKGGGNELFYDLRGADLIQRVRLQDNVFELGSAFRNLKLVYPKLLKFLYHKCQDNQFKHNIPAYKNSIDEAEITIRYNYGAEPIFFSFGVCLGGQLSQKIKIDATNIESSRFYLYGKSFSNNQGLDNILFQDYLQLSFQTDFKKVFANWNVMSIPI